MAKSRLNLSVLLKHLDQRNLGLYEAFRHNSEDRKELDRLLAYVLPLWVAGSDNGRDQIAILIEFNRHINLAWNELNDHPELRAKVLGSIGLGYQVRHDFHYRATRERTTALRELLVQRYPDIRVDEIRLWCAVNSEANLIELCARYGVQQHEREPILNEYRKVLA